MTARRALSFLGLASVLLALYAYPGDEGGARLRFFEAYLSLYARLVAGVLSLVEPDVVSAGQDILGRASLRIVKGCDAMDIMLTLTAAIAVTPCSITRRLAAWLVGIAVLFVINVLRICSLYYVQIHQPWAFEAVHMELWPLLLLLLSVGGFFLWSRRLHTLATSE